MKIKNKKRFIISMSIISVIIISIFNLCFAKTSEVETEEYVVQSGDTLWSIAIKYKNENQDIRKYIYDLRNLNTLNDCMIYPGQVIKIIK